MAARRRPLSRNLLPPSAKPAALVVRRGAAPAAKRIGSLRMLLTALDTQPSHLITFRYVAMLFLLTHTTQSEPKFCRTYKQCEKRKRLAVFSCKYRKQFARPGRSLVPHTRLSSRLPACRKHRSLPRLHSQQAVLLQCSPGGGNQVGIDRRALAAAGAAEAVAHAPRFLQGTQQPPCRPGGGSSASH